jgi:hypothetical protein
MLNRIPEDVKERILGDEGLEIIAHDDFHTMCMVSHEFDHPLNKMIYLNTEILHEPEHRINCAIVHAIARYSVGEKDINLQEKEAEELLVQWGFEEELQSVRYCRAVVESDGYKVGYEWAKKQDKDYLMQHFGLYFKEWNEKGLGRMSRERFYELYDQADIPSIMSSVPRFRKGSASGSGKTKISQIFTSDESVIAGIMDAINDMEHHDIPD